MVAFVLTMPHCGSWNGKWSQEDKLHCIVRRDREVPKEYIGKSFFYNWDDGWCAEIEVKHVDYKTANQLRNKSSGFCNYGWMVDSIIKKGRIEYNA